MLLLELRYNKPKLVDNIMAVIDDILMGGNPEAAEVLTARGIDLNQDMDDIRRQLLMADEMDVARLYRAVLGGGNARTE